MPQFDSFVILADRRTGSNFLETNINAIAGLSCHGEAFNPNFIGYPKADNILGVSKKARDADPHSLLARIKSSDGLNGFRYFGSHDDRVIDTVLADPRCAKILLTRDPVESFVSLEIARATNQWLLKSVARRRTQKITFDAEKFTAYLSGHLGHQTRWLTALKKNGQAAFRIDYDDLQDLDVINGLVAYLGGSARLPAIDQTLKKQNPTALSDKVDNFEDMQRALSTMGWTGGVRGKAPFPDCIAAAKSPLVYIASPHGPKDAVLAWLAGLDGVSIGELQALTDSASLRLWKSDCAGHRSFAVVRHPVAYAFALFRLRSASTGKQAFHAFLTDSVARYPTQADALSDIAGHIVPDVVMREDTLEDDLAIIAAQVGKDEMPEVRSTDPLTADLVRIYDKHIEVAARDAFGADYVTFGFGDYA